MKKLALIFGILLCSVNADPISDKEAKRYFKTSCDKAEYISCDMLGNLYATTKEFPFARKYWEIACDGGYNFSCHKLFIMYFRGDGVKQSFALSKKYCAKSYNSRQCQTADDLFKNFMANSALETVLEKTMVGNETDYKILSYRTNNSANDEFKRLFNNLQNGDEKLKVYNLVFVTNALESGNIPSVNECDRDTCYALGGFYIFGEQGGDIFAKIKDENKAIEYLQRAIDLGNNLGYEALAMIYRNKGDIKKAKYYYGLGCKNGDYTSCHNVGWLYKEDKDYINAKKYLEMACSKNNKVADSRVRGCMNLGMMYEGGLGVLHSYPKAIEYYKIACDLKSAHACLAISNIYLKYAKKWN